MWIPAEAIPLRPALEDCGYSTRVPDLSTTFSERPRRAYAMQPMELTESSDTAPVD